MAEDVRGPQPGLDWSLTVASSLLNEKGRPLGTLGQCCHGLAFRGRAV